MARAQHDIKEYQRSLDKEIEQCRHIKGRLQESEANLQSKMMSTQISSSSHQSSEHITQLEKVKEDINEKLKAETEITVKYKKSYSKLHQRFSSTEQAYAEMQRKYSEGVNSRMALNKTLLTMESALDQGCNERNSNLEQTTQLDKRMPSLQSEVTWLKDQKTQLLQDDHVFMLSVIKFEKNNASIEPELNTLRQRHEQDSAMHREVIACLNADKKHTHMSKEESSMEVIEEVNRKKCHGSQTFHQVLKSILDRLYCNPLI